MVLHGFTQRELQRRAETPGPLGVLAAAELGEMPVTSYVEVVDTYVEMALRSGFPEPALRLTDATRRAWLEAYIEHVVSRDVRAAGQVRDPARLRRYLQVLGLSTAGLLSAATLYEAAGINQRTAVAYDRLVESLYLLDRLPAWSENRLTALVRRPKRYLADRALAMAAAGVDAVSILLDGDLLGRVLDTFVAAQLRPELALRQPRAGLYHLRTEKGRQEIDLVADIGGGRLIGIEVKATSAPGPRDARHLNWLAEQIGERFVRGIVFHTGPQSFELGDRIWALPMGTLWMG